jgi:tetratricopeptide (TPR) repeat protein
MVVQALAGGGARAASFEAGMVNGVHYLQLVEPIKQLKREGRLTEALELCEAAITGAEAAREGREPAPWYTEQAAIIYRKLGQRDNEIAVLSRWLQACPSERREGSRIKERLDKISG